LAAQQGWAVAVNDTQGGGQGGAIVNLSSVAARLGGAGQYVDHAASKGAIEGFTIGLAREIAADSIRASGGQPHRAHELAPQIPMQRPGTAEEVTQAIVWLLGEQSSCSTGGIIEATGGR
jgi:NAD(P)-dependent dehydrogenase (short-subunit alcohol dehydrogenase family)